MAKRLNVEKSLGNSEFKAKIGSVHRTNPISIYVIGKAYIRPEEKRDNYEEDIDGLTSDLNLILKKYTASNSFINRQFICNLEIPRNGLKYGKNTYMFFQLFFSQNFANEVCKNMDEIKEKMSPWITDVLNEFKNKICERGFTIHEKRK